MEKISKKFYKKLSNLGLSERDIDTYRSIKKEEHILKEDYKKEFSISDTFAKQMVKYNCNTPEAYRIKRKIILSSTH